MLKLTSSSEVAAMIEGVIRHCITMSLTGQKVDGLKPTDICSQSLRGQWMGDTIRRQYDQMIKYSAALRLGTAETDAIVRRFTRSDVQHPIYKALAARRQAIKSLILLSIPARGKPAPRDP